MSSHYKLKTTYQYATKIFNKNWKQHVDSASITNFSLMFLGTLGNAGKAPDKGLSIKLRPLVKALRDTNKLIEQAFAELDAIKWDTTQLCREGNETPTNCSVTSLLSSIWPADPLDQIIACARVLTEDVRQVASFIQVNIYSSSNIYSVENKLISSQRSTTNLIC